MCFRIYNVLKKSPKMHGDFVEEFDDVRGAAHAAIEFPMLAPRLSLRFLCCSCFFSVGGVFSLSVVLSCCSPGLVLYR